MYRKEVSERSPMRVFERSIHGGLGKGNVGVVMSRAGVGKTAFLVDIALDALMRERKVLHVNIDDPVEKVREFYDEIFNDLAENAKLENRDRAHLVVERNRLIQTYGHETFSLEKVKQGIAIAQEHMNFDPEVIVFDGYPRFSKTTEAEMREVKEIAKQYDCELWLSGRARREDEVDGRGVPTKIARFDDLFSVLVKLEPQGDHIRLQLLKDHDNQNLADLFLELDPATLLVKWR
jgi:KaiC/GvpD/RAD55 family RecA-like ATPase